MTVTSATNRRRFLQYLAASPLVAPLVASSALAEEGITWPRGETDPMIWAPGRLENLIKSAKDAIDVTMVTTTVALEKRPNAMPEFCT